MQSKTVLPSLTGLRGLAAILVFWYHARWRAGDPSIPLGSIDLRDVLLACDGGVGIFFVLSGFLLSSSYWRNFAEHKLQGFPLQSYFIRRFMRIAPAYYLSLIHTHLFTNLTYTFWGAISLILYLLGLHTFFHQSYEWSVNPILWSIGIEAQFYVLLPILFSVAFRIETKINGSLTSLFVITVLSFTLNPLYKEIALSLAAHLPATILGGEGAASSPAVNRSVFYYLPWFWCGIVSAWLHQTRLVQPFDRHITSGKQHANILFITGVLGTAWILLSASEGEWRSFSFYGWPSNCLFFGCLVIAAPYSSLGKLLLNNPLMIFIGEVSYGIYLWHWLIQVTVFQGSIVQYLNGAHLLLVGGIISFVVTVVIASLSYFLVERPAIALAHRCQSFSDLWQHLRIKFQY